MIMARKISHILEKGLWKIKFKKRLNIFKIKTVKRGT